MMIRSGKPTGTFRNLHCRGFTLVELLLVLLILTVLATVAVQSLAPQIDQARFEATQSTIIGVDDAMLGPVNQRGADGTPLFTGFAADMGRLPVSRLDLETSTVLTLRELWQQPPGIALFSVREATEANGAPVDQEDNEVLIPCGWNGPYLRLPVGSSTLNDGWGNRMISIPAPTTVYSHLRGEGDVDITAELQPIYGVRSLGLNNVLDSTGSGYNLDVPVALRITNAAQVSGFVAGSITVDGNVPTSGQSIVVQLYGPDPDTGLVRVDRFPATGFTAGTDSFTFADSNPSYNVKVGPHAIRAYLDDNPANGTIDATDSKSRVVYFTVRPGQNSLPTLDIVTTP